MRAVVTGGGGFLGSAIARRLLARGDQVVVLGRRRYAEIEALGAEGVAWDLSADKPGLEAVFAGADVVFHTAARAGVWGSEAEFVAINVDGTARVLAACRDAGVPRVVFTSSPSATFDGRDVAGLTEADCPLSETFLTHYPRTKAAAERLCLAANSASLATTALRPHLIWGPGDPHLLPRLLARARAGRLAIVGDGQNEVGITHIDNAALAHVLAADALAAPGNNAGLAYFLHDPAPVALWPWVNRFLTAAGAPPVTRRVPAWLASAGGACLEAAWSLLGRAGEPPMTRFVAAQLSTSHWWDLSAAEADFGYAPDFDPDAALDATAAWFRAHA